MVAKRGYVPDRGDIVWLDFNPVRGHEQKGKRPGLVISPKAYNAKAGLALICPITSHQKGYPFEIPLAVGSVEGVVLADQIRAVDWKERRAEKVAKAPGTVSAGAQALLLKLIQE